MEFRIPAHSKSTLDKKIVKINKKAVKLGFNPITATYGEKIYRKVLWTFRHDVGCFNESEVTVAYLPVNIDFTDLIKVNGFIVYGMLEKTSNGNIVNIVADDHGLDLVELREKTDFYCEHCNTRRAKKYLGIVKNIETGDIKFVGKSCLSEYIGIDITAIIRMMDYDYFTNCVQPEDDMDYTGFPVYFSFNNLVGYAFNGLVCNDYLYDDSTKAYILTSFFDRLKWTHTISEDMLKAFTSYCAGLGNSTSTFEQNLYLSATGNDYVHQKCINIVMGGFCSWLRKQKRNADMAKANADNEFFGIVGKRQEFELVPTGFHTYDSQYGTGVIVKGIQANTGNKFTWFTSINTNNGFLNEADTGDLEVIEKPFKVSATVKGHKADDRFGNSTVLTRVSFK